MYNVMHCMYKYYMYMNMYSHIVQYCMFMFCASGLSVIFTFLGCATSCGPLPSTVYKCIICYSSWWHLVVRKARVIVKYLVFGVFIILLDRLHQKYGRSRNSSSASSDTLVMIHTATWKYMHVHVHITH